MVPFNLKVLAKIGLCSNCSQKLNGCSLARARKIFATARMLALSLTCTRLLEISLILLIKERFQLAENLRSTRSARCSLSLFFQSARCSPSVFSKVLAARKKNLTTARARKNKHSGRMLAKCSQRPFDTPHKIPF